MENKDTFQGSYKTQRGYKEFNNLVALWFSDSSKNNYRLTKEKIGKDWYFVISIADTYKPIYKIKIK